MMTNSGSLNSVEDETSDRNPSIVASDTNIIAECETMADIPEQPGIGIAPENQSKLFQPFMQIDGSLSRQYEGSGLGLMLVKQIVELHGGKMSVSSKFGRGSTLALPCLIRGSILGSIQFRWRSLWSGESTMPKQRSSKMKQLRTTIQDLLDSI